MTDPRTLIARRSLLKAGAALPLFSITHQAAAAEALPVVPVKLAARVPQRVAATAPIANRAPLAAQPFLSLPVGAIRPTGWLKRQMEVQASGLGGRLDETWGDVGNTSGWLGGPGEKWERGPYFLDGLLPLAWALDNARLKAKAQAFVEWTLASARLDGLFGPADNDDWWPRMVMLKVLTQYHDLTNDARVITLMTNYFVYQISALPTRPLKDWGRFRWQDQLVAMLWLYNRTGDARILTLARLLREQGWDWRAEFADFAFKDKVTPQQIHLNEEASGDLANTIRDTALSAHGVNAAMGVKQSPVWSLVSDDASDRAAINQALAVLDQYHGLPIGIFSADEHFAGRSPSQGVELCTVVEMLFSLEQAMAITGDAAIGDRIERIAYNALPGAFTDDMWSHQYDQQPNQIRSSLSKGPWTTNGPESNLFGLEPHFGCCTANFHQGWPKLLSSLFMATSDGGLAAMIYAPATVETVVAGVPVTLVSATDYPFRDTVSISIKPARPVRFHLKLRVPAWSNAVSVKINGRSVAAPAVSGFAKIDRSWHAGDRVEIAFDNGTHRVSGYRGSVSIAHGPLLYALPIGTTWKKLRQRGLSADWQVTPTTPWNYAIADGAQLHRTEYPVPPIPFSGSAPGATVTAPLIRVDAWQADGSYAAPPPASPVATTANRETLTLIPYAAAKLRITSFPMSAT